MKAYLIDPVKREVTEVECGKGIKAIYEHIHASGFDVVTVNNHSDGVYVDDEGLLNGAGARYGGFIWTCDSGRRYPFVGYGLMLGLNRRTGASRDVQESLESVKTRVTFHSLASLAAMQETFG